MESRPDVWGEVSRIYFKDIWKEIIMEKFIPLNKMSKKKQREFHRLSRKDWGGLSPVTRKEKDPGIYNRVAEKRMAAKTALKEFLRWELRKIDPNLHGF